MQAARTYMKLGLSHQNAFEYRRARETYEKGFVFWQRAGEIQRQAELPPAPHALRLGTVEPTSIDPAVIADTASAEVTHQLFCGLVALDDELPSCRTSHKVGKSLKMAAAIFST